VMPVYRATRALMAQSESGEMSVTMEEGQMVDINSGDVFPELERLLRDGSLVPVPALDSLDRDTSPLPTDFDDILLLLQDMEQWAREHQKATFLCADDPGTNSGRIPRFGWTGYYYEDDSSGIVEHSKQWTITLPNMKSTASRLPATIEGYMQTARGRQDMLQLLVEVARQPVLIETTPEVERKTLWERLQEE